MKTWRQGSKVKLNVYEGDRPVCQAHTEEDARLIAAAPELLEVALEAARIHICCCSDVDESPCLKCQARAVIAKAEGRQ